MTPLSSACHMCGNAFTTTELQVIQIMAAALLLVPDPNPVSDPGAHVVLRSIIKKAQVEPE